MLKAAIRGKLAPPMLHVVFAQGCRIGIAPEARLTHAFTGLAALASAGTPFAGKLREH